mmetsp:Transcript_11609/g.52495  ORF Transcript_11609/g.52495 Transcript_11609/m.52495 type:complete len:312 (+) Transcript_11609:1706-2641(+)
MASILRPMARLVAACASGSVGSSSTTTASKPLVNVGVALAATSCSRMGATMDTRPRTNPSRAGSRPVRAFSSAAASSKLLGKPSMTNPRLRSSASREAAYSAKAAASASLAASRAVSWSSPSGTTVSGGGGGGAMRKRTCFGSNPPGSTRPTNAAKGFRSRLRLLGSLASAGCGSHSRPPHRRVPSRRFHAHTLPSAMPLTTTSPATATDRAATAPSARRTCARRAVFDAATSAAVDARAPDLALSTRRVIVSSETASSSPRSHTHTRAHPGSAGHAPPAHTAVPSGETAREKTSNPSGLCASPHSNLNPV